MKLIKWRFKQQLLPKMKNPKFIWGSSLLLGGALYFKLWLPLTNLAIPCPFYKITGHYCPGCGMTRAISAILQGDVARAWHNNALLFIVPCVFIIYVLMKKLKLTKQAEIMLYMVISIALLYGILRNIPMFSFLAPIPIK